MTQVQLKAKYITISETPSIWLSLLPLKDEKCSLTKREFFDAVLLRYGWVLKNLKHKSVCTAKHNINHVITSKTGGFITLCHNELYVTTDMLSMVCKDICNQN